MLLVKSKSNSWELNLPLSVQKTGIIGVDKITGKVGFWLIGGYKDGVDGRSSFAYLPSQRINDHDYYLVKYCRTQSLITGGVPGEDRLVGEKP